MFANKARKTISLFAMETVFLTVHIEFNKFILRGRGVFPIVKWVCSELTCQKNVTT